MESSLAMRLRSDERVIELKADFQIAVRLLQSQIRLWTEKEIEKTEKGMRKNCVGWLFWEVKWSR